MEINKYTHNINNYDSENVITFEAAEIRKISKNTQLQLKNKYVLIISVYLNLLPLILKPEKRVWMELTDYWESPKILPDYCDLITILADCCQWITRNLTDYWESAKIKWLLRTRYSHSGPLQRNSFDYGSCAISIIVTTAMTPRKKHHIPLQQTNNNSTPCRDQKIGDNFFDVLTQ